MRHNPLASETHHGRGGGDHQHGAPAENYSARAHPEFVVLDIGENIGALILYTNPDLHGEEVEISPTGEDGQRSHKDVLERCINGRPSFTAVFDGLHEGTYTLWHRGVARARDVTIKGSAVTELDWTHAAAGTF